MSKTLFLFPKGLVREAVPREPGIQSRRPRTDPGKVLQDEPRCLKSGLSPVAKAAVKSGSLRMGMVVIPNSVSPCFHYSRQQHKNVNISVGEFASLRLGRGLEKSHFEATYPSFGLENVVSELR